MSSELVREGTSSEEGSGDDEEGDDKQTDERQGFSFYGDGDNNDDDDDDDNDGGLVLKKRNVPIEDLSEDEVQQNSLNSHVLRIRSEQSLIHFILVLVHKDAF